MVDNGDKCGCLSQPPDFDILPPPLPPMALFSEFNSIAQNIDWTVTLKSDQSLDTCQNEIDRWTNSDIVIPSWSGTDNGRETNGPGDNFVDPTLAKSDVLALLDQPLIVVIIVAAVTSILVLSICLVVISCKRKSSRMCFHFGYQNTKGSIIYQSRNGYSPSSLLSTNGRLRTQKSSSKFRTVIEAASPATTTTTVIAAKTGYLTGYGLSNRCDSAEEISDGENDYFLNNGTAAATDWSYNAMTPRKRSERSKMNTRIPINGGQFSASKYGAIPTDPIAYERTVKPQAVMILKTESGHYLTRYSPSSIVPPNRTDRSVLYDNNPIYEEIPAYDKPLNQRSNYHETNIDQCPIYQPQKMRNFGDGVVNYVDSGASSAHSDSVNLPMVDEDYDEEQAQNRPDVDTDRQNRYCDTNKNVTELTAGHSPCCSSGRSECDECCLEVESIRTHSRNECPFSPRPRSRNRQHLDQDSIPTISATPSPIKGKLSINKVSRSTQSGESCFANDELYANTCYECSGRESGYGTEGRRTSSSGHVKNSKTMNVTGRRGDERFDGSQRIASSLRFYTLKNTRDNCAISRSPVLINQITPPTCFVKPNRTQADTEIS